MLRCATKAGAIGFFTLFPPSRHPSGEEIRFAKGKQANAGPPTVDADHLVRTVHRIGAAALFAAHWVPSGGGRHECMLALSGTLVTAGWSAEETFDFCDALYRSLPDLDPAQIGRVRSEVSSTYEKHVNGQRITGAARLAELIDAKVVKTALSWLQITEAPSAGSDTDGSVRKAEIEITGKDQETLTEETLEFLYRVNTPPKIFTQLQSVVEILRDKRNNITVKEVHSPTLRHQIHRATRFTKKGELCNMPAEIPQDILTLSTEDLKFPELQGIIRGPVMRRDGSIITAPGYDEATGLLYIEDPSLEVRPIPSNPTSDEAGEAMLSLLHYMREFPFPDQASKANALAAMITPVVRPVIDAVIPMGIISAVSAASGKTTLGDQISICATGTYGGYMGAPTRPEEWSKRITSALRKGASVIVIDNVKETQPLDSPDLCRLITDREWADRELQFSREIRIPNLALWLATGNNLKVGGDMGTRCFLIKLDAGPDPSSRKFSTDVPHDYWKRERGTMLSAALTAARAWVVAGSPRPKSTPNTRFPEWTRIVGGILEHSGIFGFLGNYEELRAATDEEAAQWEAFHRTVLALFPAPFQVRHLVDKLAAEPDLKDALPTSLRALAGKPDAFAMALGKEYSSRANRPYGRSGLKIVLLLGTAHGNAMKYQIERSR